MNDLLKDAGPELLKYLVAALITGNLFFIRELVNKVGKTYDAVIKLSTRVHFLETRMERGDGIRYVSNGNGSGYGPDGIVDRREDD